MPYTISEIASICTLINLDDENISPDLWISKNKDILGHHLNTSGAVLVRGLRIKSIAQFQKVLSTAFGGDLLEYLYRSTPRTEVRGHIYTATEYPSGETILQHSENAYSNNWPLRIGFWALVPPAHAGATTISDNRKVLNRIPKEIVREFAIKGVRYVRNYGDIDLPWQEVFQCTDKAHVEAYCKSAHIEYEWIGNNRLRTSQTNPALATHPITGQLLWFNQAHIFHTTALPPDVRNSLETILDASQFPRNALFGDGTEIPIEFLDLIREAFRQETNRFAWQKNDILLLDNMLISHGREPYSGPRKILTGMAQAHHSNLAETSY